MDEANHNPNKIWLDKGNEVFKRSLKSWLHDNNIEMYLTHNEGNHVVAERFSRTLRNKILKYLISILKNIYIKKLDDVINKYNNTYTTMAIEPVVLKSRIYIDFNKENNKEYPKFKVGYPVRI